MGLIQLLVVDIIVLQTSWCDMTTMNAIPVIAGFILGVSIVIVYFHYMSRVEVLRFSQSVEQSRNGGADDDFEDYLADASRLSGSKRMAKLKPMRLIEPSLPLPPVKRQMTKSGQENIQDLYSWASVEEPNPFIRHVLRAVTAPSSLVLFTGHSAKHIFDLEPPTDRTTEPSSDVRKRLSQYKHLTLNHKQRTRWWSEIARLISETHEWNNNNYTQRGEPINKAVRIHNEHKVGDLLLHLVQEGKKARARGYGGPSLITKQEITRAMEHGQPPVVLTNSVDENWGFLSSGINTRTTEWINMTNHLRIHESNYDTLRGFLDSDKVVLVLVNTHVAPALGAHPKVLSLPLGYREMAKNFRKAREVAERKVKKRRLMQINNSGWGDRAVVNEQMKDAFHGTVQNSYKGAKTINDTDRGMGGPNNKGKARRARRVEKLRKEANMRKQGEPQGRNKRRLAAADVYFDHMLETAESRFALSPSGLGMDTYRLWQALLMGTVPVVESNAGLDRTYASLPVLVVHNYSDLNPQLLRRAWPCFRDNAHKFNYEALTMPYWLNLIDTAVRTADITHVMNMHPYRNKYCDFL